MNPYLLTSVRALLLCLIPLVLSGCESVSQEGGGKYRHHRFSLFSYKIRSDGQRCLAEWSKAPPLAPSLWQRIERRYQLPNSTTNERIIRERNWYARHQAYLHRVSARSSRYLYHVANQLEAKNLPGELALLPIVESAYNPFAISTSNASGLWQFIPSTAKHLKMEMNWWYDARRDIPAATDTAINYLIFLRDHYEGDWLKAIAAYNAGWGTIDKAVAKNRARGLPTDYWNLDVPAETMAYVPKLLALAQISKNPELYGVNWAYVPDLPYFAEVHFSGQLDVAFAADLANIDSDELHMLNPGISRWATPPGGPYRLLVPVDKATDLQERIAGMRSGDLMPSSSSSSTLFDGSANPHVQAMEEKAARNTKSKSSSTASSNRSSNSSSGSYTVKSGDTLWSIARKTGVTTEALRKANGMRTDDALKLGQRLTLPGNATSSNTTPDTTTTVASRSVTRSAAHSAGRVNQSYKPATAASTTSKASTTASTKGKTTYTVKSGDTLMAISRKYGVTVNDIQRWNALSKSNTSLKPGQKLTLQLGTQH